MSIQTTYDKLYPLWTMLGVSEDEMEDFVNRHMGSTLDVVNAVRPPLPRFLVLACTHLTAPFLTHVLVLARPQYQAELARMLQLKRTNMSAFIARERESLTALWDALYVSHAQRVAQFPAYAISVEPTRVWNAAHGCEDEVVSDNVSEELLVAHERERERLEREVDELRPVLDRLARYFEVVEKTKELEVRLVPPACSPAPGPRSWRSTIGLRVRRSDALDLLQAAAADPSRLMDKSRGAAGRLAQEAKDRKRVDRERPKVRPLLLPLPHLVLELVLTLLPVSRSSRASSGR